MSGDAPYPRAAHSMEYKDDYIWIFGGNNNFEFFNDIHRFNITNNTWEFVNYTQNPNNPVPRAGHTMILFDDIFLIYGGGDSSQFFDHLYFFDLKECSFQLKHTKVLWIIE